MHSRDEKFGDVKLEVVHYNVCGEDRVFAVAELRSLEEARAFFTTFDTLPFKGVPLVLYPAEKGDLVAFGMSRFIREDELYALLKQKAPDLKRVTLLDNPNCGESTGTAFLEFESFPAAKHALQDFSSSRAELSPFLGKDTAFSLAEPGFDLFSFWNKHSSNTLLLKNLPAPGKAFRVLSTLARLLFPERSRIRLFFDHAFIDLASPSSAGFYFSP